MKNSEQPISPCMMQQVGEDTYRVSKPNDPKEWNTPVLGLTKREYFAGLAMKGLLVNFYENGLYGNSVSSPMISEIAVRCADDLLKELEKPTEPC